MNPSEFSELLERYRKGLATPEEISKIDAWYENIARDKDDLPFEEIQKRKERSLAGILSEKPGRAAPEKSALKRIIYRGTAVAAFLALGVLLFIFTDNSKKAGRQLAKKTPPVTTEESLFTNHSSTNRLVVLADGSTVLLSPGSSLTCVEGFGKKHRKTLLAGNGFFEIYHREDLPFSVLCGEIVTKVLGTSFWIRSSSESKAVEVTVKTGKVSVFKNEAGGLRQSKPEQAPLVTLLPNQSISFSAKSREETPRITSIKKGSVPDRETSFNYLFDKTPLDKVFDVISTQYQLDIRLNIPSPGSCTFTGDINDLSLLEKLEIICFSTGTTFEIQETALIISGDNCI
ncbi:MAG: hypothetical protein ABS46_10420 [Cytophagaceae bacterium SCN 52-12]|nr:MAG: hypothetical protein ABS46_10420 [Cytophagaceae bacterium SCN 52-12]